jgi:hypothetical protein
MLLHVGLHFLVLTNLENAVKVISHESTREILDVYILVSVVEVL